MANQAMKLSVLITADASGVKPGATDAQAGLDAVSASANKAGDALDNAANAGRDAGTALGEISAESRATAAALDDVATSGTAVGASLEATSTTGRAALETIGATSRTTASGLASIETAANDAGQSIRQVAARQTELQHASHGVSANIAAQFQDIVVSSTLGMSAMQVALEQGTQLAGVLATTGGGLRGALATIAGGFSSLLSPVALVTVGLTAAASAAISYFSTAAEGADTSAAALEKQASLIERVAKQWGEAYPEIKAYADQLKAAADAADRLEAVRIIQAEKLKSVPETLAATSIDTTDVVSRLNLAGDDEDNVRQFQDDVAKAATAMRSGDDATDAFNAAIADLKTSILGAGNPAIAEMIIELEKLRDQARKTAEDVGRIGAVPLSPSVAATIDQQHRSLSGFDSNGRNYLPGDFTPTVIPRPTPRPSDLDNNVNVPSGNADQNGVRQAMAQLKEAQDQTIAKLREEAANAGATSEQQARLTAVLQAQQELRRQGINLNSQEAKAYISNADAVAQLTSVIQRQQALKNLQTSQQDQIDQLRVEADAIGQTADARARAVAALQAEQQLRQANIEKLSEEGRQYIANAQAIASAQVALERQQAAYQTVQQAEGGMIDTLVNGLSTAGNSWKDTFKNMLQQGLQTFNQLAVANPLKNELLHTNLPTLGDLVSGKPALPASATSTAAMTVTAGTVTINGTTIGTGVLPFAGATATVPGTAATNVSRLLPAANQNAPSTDVEAYIRQAALTRGIDPDTAVAVARSEGGLSSWNTQSKVPLAGGPGGFEPSYGPYQLYMNGGLGNSFQAKTGLDPRLAQNGPQGVDYALDYAKNNGWSAFHGAANTGISNWQGIRPGVDPQTTNSINQFNTSVKTAADNVGHLGPAATDASKALTSGDNSLVSSINKASQTAAQPTAPIASAGGSAASGAAAGGSNPLGGIFGAIGGLVKGIGSVFSSIFQGIAGALSKVVSGIGSGIGSIFGSIFGFADGGVFDKPTLFPMAGQRVGMLGEDGPEAIMPLRRGSDGKLGVRMAMPRQIREGGGSLALSLNSTNTYTILGNGDAELKAQMHEIARMHGQDLHNRIRADMPDMIEDWRRNPETRRTY